MATTTEPIALGPVEVRPDPPEGDVLPVKRLKSTSVNENYPNDFVRTFPLAKLNPAFDMEELVVLGISWKSVGELEDSPDGLLSSEGSVSVASVPKPLEASYRKYLGLGSASVASSGTSTPRVAASSASDSDNITELDFREVASTNDPDGALKILDLGKLLAGDSAVEAGGSIFQMNTKQGIYLFRAASSKEKQIIVGLLKMVFNKEETPQAGPGKTPLTRNSKDSARELMARIEERFTGDATKLSAIENDLDTRIDALSSLIAELKSYESSRAQIAREVRQSERTNEELVARLTDMENKAVDATQKLDVLQQKIFSKLEGMMGNGSVGAWHE